MDKINSVYDILTENLKNERKLIEVSNYFNSLKTDFDRFELCFKLLDEYGVFPEVELVSTKSTLESERLRNDGNSAFLKRQEILAIQCYSSSAACAPNDGKEIALAFANRSAVTFALKQYHDSLKDIDRALSGKYPDNLRYKLYERKGKCLQHLRAMESARENYQEALNWVNKSTLSEEKKLSFQLSLKLHLEESDKQVENYEPEEKSGTYNYDGSSIVHCPELSFDPSDEIMCTGDAVRIEYNPDLGRHLVATTNVHPGDVLAVERPYASILFSSAYMLYCFHCLQRCHSLIPCNSCTKVLFCSTKCQEISWNLYHCIDCTVLANLIDFGCSKLELLSVRTLILASKVDKLNDLTSLIDNTNPFDDDPRKIGLNESNKYDSADYRTVHFLARNTELRSNADLFRRALFAACIIFFIDQCTDYFTINTLNDLEHPDELHYLRCQAGGLLLRYMQIMPCNAHEVSEMCVMMSSNNNNTSTKNHNTQISVDGKTQSGTNFFYDSNEIGGALYPLLSLINHSCDPNVVRHSHNGDTVVLTAIQEITKGEQIFDNYGYHHAVHDLKTRQSHLKSQYHFTCACRACTDNWAVYHLLPDSDPVYLEPLEAEVRKSSEEFRSVFDDVLRGHVQGKMAVLVRHLSLLHRAIERPWKEYSECQEAIKQCLSLQANHYIYQHTYS